MKKKLFITRPLPENVIKKAGLFFTLNVRKSVLPTKKQELVYALQNFDAIIGTIGDEFNSTVFSEVIKPRTKIIANFGVGYDHLDLNAAKNLRIKVTNTPNVVTDATADIAMALILMVCRRAVEGDRLVRSGEWKGWNPMQMLGAPVSGSTLGIIGMGRIGKAIARRGNLGFGMPVLYYNRSEVPDDGLQNSHQVNNLDDLLVNADIVVISLPGGPETYHLINRKSFEKMKSTSILINIARGEIVNEIDLMDALKNKIIRGAGLDVYEFEPKVPKALTDLENVVLLPHLGTAALPVREKMGEVALENIMTCLLDQKEPPNLIN